MPTSPVEACAGFVLAGGFSSRMGKDKALLEISGAALVVRAARLAAAECAPVTIVGRLEDSARFGFPAIADERPRLGPLGGILTALDHTAAAWNLILACDLPYLTGEWLRFLISRARASRAQVVLPVSASGPEPLCAVYHRASARPIRSRLEQGILKITEAIEAAGVERISPEEILPFDARGVLFQNLNTPADYERARADLEGE